ncbi:MAG TPA: M1 family peptidase [Nannocystis exedens]|nr:M1 family peptidase [Nannocystis exedens]
MITCFRGVSGVMLAVLLGVSSAACDASAPKIRGDVAEPESALRPEEVRGRVPEQARIADYVIDASLDAQAHRITGSARITWHNRSSKMVGSLPFHLYMNAFRAEDTAWMREARGSHRGQKQGEEGTWGYIDVKGVNLVSPPNAADLGHPEARAEQPLSLSWSEDSDPSTMQVELVQPIPPGETVVVEIDFVTQLPKVFARTGYADDFHMVGQWYPKLGVLDPQRGWQAHTFTLNSEFFADFGDYEVSLDLPEDMVVGASGILVAEEASGEGRKRLRYRASMVHDFAWAADPEFVEVRTSWHGIRIRQLMRPEFAADAERHDAALQAALGSMEGRFGPYPWSTITVIHPPANAGGAQGMEYPTLFTSSIIVERSPWWALVGFDERASGVFTTIHEFGHQYFQGLLASDEFREPWLDEGMNTTSNVLALHDWLGPEAWIVRLGSQSITQDDAIFLSMGSRSNLDPVRASADSYLALTRSFGSTVYRKTAATMLSLRNLAGAEKFDRAMRLYADTWRFAHPTGDDLLGLLAREIGPSVTLRSAGDVPPIEWDLEEFLRQAMETTEQVDFALIEVKNRRGVGERGWHRDEEGLLVGGEEPPPSTPLDELEDDEVEGVVIIERKGGLRMPVELNVDFVQGASQRLWWDGEDRYHVFTWPGRRLKRVQIDPDEHNLLESARNNNLRYAEDPPADGLSKPVDETVQIVSLALMGGIGL